MTVVLPPLSLVLGGASSGKSAYAEQLAERAGLPLTYLATAEARDPEMQEKIARHQDRRSAEWRTVETALGAAGVLSEHKAGGVVLLDCLTLWLSNHLFAETDLALETEHLLDALASCKSPVIIVSNELGLGGVGSSSLERQFQRLAGALNQRIAAQAQCVIFVAAGLPLAMKGAPL